MKLTDADQQLLSMLRENARASTAQIARRLSLSRTTVQSRIERLEREGVISGYTVRVHDEYDRSHLRAQGGDHRGHLLGMHGDHDVRAMPELRVLHSVSGSHDLIAIGAVPSVGDMDLLTDRIGALEGVERTTSSIVLSTKFER